MSANEIKILIDRIIELGTRREPSAIIEYAIENNHKNLFEFCCEKRLLTAATLHNTYGFRQDTPLMFAVKNNLPDAFNELLKFAKEKNVDTMELLSQTNRSSDNVLSIANQLRDKNHSINMLKLVLDAAGTEENKMKLILSELSPNSVLYSISDLERFKIIWNAAESPENKIKLCLAKNHIGLITLFTARTKEVKEFIIKEMLAPNQIEFTLKNQEMQKAISKDILSYDIGSAFNMGFPPNHNEWSENEKDAALAIRNYLVNYGKYLNACEELQNKNATNGVNSFVGAIEKEQLIKTHWANDLRRIERLPKNLQQKVNEVLDNLLPNRVKEQNPGMRK